MSLPEGRKPRLVIIGLDGATWDLIEPLAAEGKMPAISRIREESAHGKLRSVIPPVTAPAWATMLTGRDPGEHGVFAMTMPDADEGGRFRPVTMGDWKAKPLWTLLNECGLTTGFMGVPFTFPPPRVNGWMISGIMGTPRYNERMFNPSTLFPEVTEAAREYPLDPPSKAKNTMPFATLKRQIEWIRDASVHLLNAHPVDVFMVVENYTDHVGHDFFRSRNCTHEGKPVDVIEHAYRGADELVAAIAETVGDDCPIIVVSDHGMGTLDGFINLEAALKVQAGATGRALLRAVWRGLVKVLPSEWVTRIRHKYAARSQAGRTIPFAGAQLTLTGLEGAIRVVADSEEARKRVVDKLVETLAPVSDDSGNPLFEPLRREELYSGPLVEEAPDLIAWPANQAFEHILRAPKSLPMLPTNEQVKRAGVAKAQLDPEGSHRLDGIVLANAAASRLADEAGSALPQHLREVCGYCLDICLDPETCKRVDMAAQSDDADAAVYGDDDKDLIEQRLADLGYL